MFFLTITRKFQKEKSIFSAKVFGALNGHSPTWRRLLRELRVVPSSVVEEKSRAIWASLKKKKRIFTPNFDKIVFMQHRMLK